MKLPFLANEISRLRSPNEVDKVIKKFISIIPKLNGSTIACCINILSKKGSLVSHDNLGKITSKLLIYDKNNNNPYLLECIDARDACTILNSFSSLNYKNDGFLNAVSDKLNGCLDILTCRESANAIFSLTKFGHSSLPVHKEIKKQVKGKNLTEQDTSMLITAMCSGKGYGNEDLNLLLDNVDMQKNHLSDQSLSNIVNSISKLTYNSSNRNKYVSFLNRLIPIIKFRLDNSGLTGQGISNIANGYGKLGIKDEGLFHRIGINMVSRITEFTPRGVINVLNAYSKIDYFHKDSFVVSAEYIIDKLDVLTPQCFGNVLAAYAKFNHLLKDKIILDFYKKCSEKLAENTDFSNYIPQNYCNILSGLSKVGVIDDELFNKFSIELEKSDYNFIPTDVCVLIRAYSRVSIWRKEFLLKFCKLAGEMSSRMSPKELTSSIIALKEAYRVNNDDGLKILLKNTLENLLIAVKDKVNDNVSFTVLDIKRIRHCIKELRS